MSEEVEWEALMQLYRQLHSGAISLREFNKKKEELGIPVVENPTKIKPQPLPTPDTPGYVWRTAEGHRTDCTCFNCLRINW
jgi:hypothetical protein